MLGKTWQIVLIATLNFDYFILRKLKGKDRENKLLLEAEIL